MGRVATNCADPVVLYVSGGNTQVLVGVGGGILSGQDKAAHARDAYARLGATLVLELPLVLRLFFFSSVCSNSAVPKALVLAGVPLSSSSPLPPCCCCLFMCCHLVVCANPVI